MTNQEKAQTLNYANRLGYSDVYPFEIIKRNTANKITVRSMKHSENKNKHLLKFHVGGFAANCSNQEMQEYDYFSDEEGEIIELRYSKKTGQWKSKYDERFSISEKPRYFYDYNF